MFKDENGGFQTLLFYRVSNYRLPFLDNLILKGITNFALMHRDTDQSELDTKFVKFVKRVVCS